MTSKSPIFPIKADSHHFTDYGFDPHFNYFQVLEEAQKSKHETSSSRSIDSLRFKLQKPTLRSNDSKKINKNRKRPKWWRNTLHFFKNKWAHTHSDDQTDKIEPYSGIARIKSISGPIYITESVSGGSTPYRKYGSLGNKGNVNIPYVSLRELNVDPPHRISASAMPIYLVT